MTLTWLLQHQKLSNQTTDHLGERGGTQCRALFTKRRSVQSHTSEYTFTAQQLFYIIQCVVRCIGRL